MTKASPHYAGQAGKDRKDLFLNIMIAAGAVIVIIFGFLTHLIQHWGLDLQHWDSWELGALLWTGVFVIFYFSTLQLTKKDGPDKTIMVLLVLIVLSTIGAGVFLIYQRQPTLHVVFVSVVGVCLMSVDGLLAKHHRNKRYRKAFCESFRLAGVPMVIAYLVLTIYLLTDLAVHRWFLHTDVEDCGDSVSGAISFQLLISNVIFVLLHKGVLENIVQRPKSRQAKKSDDKRLAT